jgi:hypothetical protein
VKGVSTTFDRQRKHRQSVYTTICAPVCGGQQWSSERD